MNEYNVHNMKINPAEFQHPIDKKATELVMGQDAFRKALQFISKNSVERQMLCLYRATYAQLTPRNAPCIFQMIEEACEMFGTKKRPEVYLHRTYFLDVTTKGVDTPVILLSTELLRQLDDRMLWGILAAEIAGIRGGYCEINMVDWLCSFTGLLPAIITGPLKTGIEKWRKYYQYSYDRANLIATGSLNLTMRSILAGQAPAHILENMNFEDPECDYMKQTREFLSKTGHWTELMRDYTAFMGAETYPAARYMDLYQFAHKEYYDIVEDYLED